MGAVLACVFLTAFLATLWAIWPARPAPTSRWARSGGRPGGCAVRGGGLSDREGGREQVRAERHRTGGSGDGRVGAAAGVRARAGLVSRLWRARGARRGWPVRVFSAGGLERVLMRAALELTPGEFCLLSLLTAVLGAAAGLLFGRPALFLLGAVGGGAVPTLWVRRRVARRLASFERQLPDALTMIGGALRAGQSFLQAVDTVSREVPPPLGPELSRLVQETRVNVPLEDALRHLAARVGSPDLDLVVAAVSVQREVGGNLAQVIDRVGQTVRERLRLRGEIRTLTAQGRLSGLIVGCLPLVLGVLIWCLNPEYLGILLTNTLGQLMLGGAAVMAVIGFLLIRKLVSVDM